ncbi:DUF2357 domain-containing protein [Weeksellaceae bacterium KMM 9713]|uniref:DUF2357 domain-containing protein n=1 Tax=Profundicola chukchiensis TaxID=2961959 RepID=A0A9X4RVZ7_9FLAO|nr:DUF2357 domain-containing protein [Profundicola chukchiensis]MDG4946365.1 DUF2357 domain-containing protein [Profundicola chukchiensis]
MTPKNHISIPLNHISQGLILHIYPEGNSRVFKIDDAEAEEYGESPYQILESQTYEYAFNKKGYRLKCDYNDNVVKQSRREKYSGRINPSYFVGTLKLNVYHKKKNLNNENFNLEVLATKFNSDDLDKSYRDNYRYMLESITEKCTELLFQLNAPIYQHFETDFSSRNQNLYQQFCFVKSIIESDEFKEAIQQITSNPKTTWTHNDELADIRSIKKFTRSSIKQIANRGNRIPVPSSHPLYQHGIKNIPSHILNNKKVEFIDNIENRFIKHALQTYLHFSEKCCSIFKKDTRAHKEARSLSNTLESLLNNSFFKEISRPTSLNFNSPVLQRKSGYREILKSWLKFDLAAKLTWSGGEDVYEAGKRDISKLYEYWLFFLLYDLFKSKFKLDYIEHDNNPYESLIETSKNKVNFIIKSGTHTAFSGISKFNNRDINVKFSFNQTFKGNKTYSEKSQGSYTKSMYPDYTLSFWPAGIDEATAEEEEIIVHIHFDAKYKVNYSGNQEESREKEEESERKGQYKNIDLFKMHAYKDAIRRTGGAYILYPGNDQPDIKLGFHEIIPGLGAFAIRPNKINNGSKELSDFIDEIINHLLNRVSQREKMSYRTYEIFKNSPKDGHELNEALPEPYGVNRDLLPDQTYVLIGYCKSKEHFEWIKNTLLYNFRMNNNKGALKLTQETLKAKYLLLHMKGDKASSKLYRIPKTEYRVTNKNTLKRLKYPRPTQNSYLVVKLEVCTDKEFQNTYWDFRKLKNYKDKRASAIPYTATLSELMLHKSTSEVK